VRSVVKEVRLEIAQINRILTDLLQTARPHPPQIRPSDLNTTVEHAVMLARQQAISRPIKITLDKDPSLPNVDHDSDQIHQVLINLLINAEQAIEGAGSIQVEVSSQGNKAMVTVADTGHGIAPEHLPNIFRPFYTTKGNGTGLGLSLARRIVEDHKGRIEVDSELGKGTEFIVTLPLRQASAEAAAS
jgi:signal transduction histidine kinase